jgi:hypothetical protein
MSANDLVKNFLGRPQNMTTFEKWMGEEFESTPEQTGERTLRGTATGFVEAFVGHSCHIR